MNSSFPGRLSFSYLNLTKICHSHKGEPKYKYGQQEQEPIRNHNRNTALERSVLKYLGALSGFTGGIRGGFTGSQPRPLMNIKLECCVLQVELTHERVTA